MPQAQLPHTVKGWIAAGLSSMVGFVSGLVALNYFNKWIK